MSTHITSATTQPFKCNICDTRFTRHENLKRHASVHEETRPTKSLTCEICNTTFSRTDLRSRHMKRKHAELDQTSQYSQKTRPNCSLPRDTLFTRSRHASSDSNEQRPDTEDSHRSRSRRPGEVDVEGNEYLTSGRGDWFSTSPEQVWRSESSAIYSARPLVDGISDLMQIDRNDTAYHTASEADSAVLSVSLSPPTPASVQAGSDSRRHNADTTYLSDGAVPRPLQRGVDLFFIHCSGALPFIHQATFDAAVMPELLLLAMASLGLQYDHDRESVQQDHFGDVLSLQYFCRAMELVESNNDNHISTSPESVLLLQALLLLEVCAVLYLCDKYTAIGFALHSRCVALARSTGLLLDMDKYPTSGQDLDAVWHSAMKSESRKRTALALHQIDALWYQVLSVPRLLSHLEIKHELPCPAEDWLAPTANDWAFRQLTCRTSHAPLTYLNSIRHFLSPTSTSSQDIPAFDTFGLINIAYFVLSSIREISGWSTISGCVSMDRVEPLKAALLALKPYSRSTPSARGAGMFTTALCEATWEMAMIELHVWSLSHTGGVVQSSVDNLLSQTTRSAVSHDLTFNLEIVESIRPHVNWFLHYLDRTLEPVEEPPWIVLFSYKVFLLTWQCLQQGIPGVLSIIGIADGDTDASLTWAKRCFRRRTHLNIGRMILKCLDALDDL